MYQNEDALMTVNIDYLFFGHMVSNIAVTMAGLELLSLGLAGCFDVLLL